MNSQRGWLVSLGLSLTFVGGCTPRSHGPGPLAPTTRSKPATPKVPPPTVADVADADSDARTLDSKVTRVTVYSDRARISRQASAEAGTEATVFAFRGLPGWVDDGSVQVSASAGRIDDVRVDRRFLARATDLSWQRVEAQHKALTDKLAALRDELAVIDAQKQQVEAIKAFSLAKITQDTIIGDIKVQSYGDVVDLSGLNPAGCEAPAGYVANDQDCDDGRATTNPSATISWARTRLRTTVIKA